LSAGGFLRSHSDYEFQKIYPAVSRKDQSKKQDEIFSNDMQPHLDLALDAVKNIDAKWSEVKRRLSSEW
jgi:hypothetical protein